MELIIIIPAVAQGILLLYLFITLFVLRFATKKTGKGNSRTYRDEKCSTKILVIIPAHNEEVFIKDTIKAIKCSKYPSHLKDIVLLADRCTDNTANVARKENVVVCDNLHNAYHTKGGILKAYFNENLSTISRYDYVCVIDADTIVDKYFFIEADRQFKRGYKIVQGKVSIYTTVKNRISGFMVIYQSILNTCFFQLLSCCNKSTLIAGKGMFFSPCVFKHIMWNEQTLIEDVDISFQAILLGMQIHYCDKIKVSCVPPHTFRDMWNQQRRWLSGQSMLIRNNFNNFISGKLIDGTKMFVIEGIICVSILPIVFTTVVHLPKSFCLILSYNVIAMLTAMATVEMDNSKAQIGIKDVLVFPFILLCWYIINIISFFCPIKFWKELKYKSSNN